MSTSGSSLECISEFCSGSSSQDSPKILAKGIRSGNTDLLSIVQALGPYLTSSTVDQRCQGTRLLSEVLRHLHTHQLPHDDVYYLASFYCDRLKDSVTVLPYVLRGLHAMVIQQNIFSDDVVLISRAIFSEVYNQSLPQGERRLVYIIVDYFLTEHIEAVKKIGSEFVLGYIQAIDGEKDPRNLVIVFNSVQRIIQHLPFDVLAEDLFEVTSCYFPIDFTPPSDDQYAVSREELVIALRKCLTASHKFAEFCLPLMLEKVSSDFLSAKLDALLTIAAGCKTFGVRGLEKYIEALWIAIRREIFQCVSQEVEAAGLQCVEEMSKTLSLSLLSGTSVAIKELTDMALKDCSRHLVEPELRLLSPASHILQAVSAGCEQACLTITSTTIPLLIEQYHNRSSVNQKKAILQVLLKFITILKHFRREDGLTPLDSHKDDLISLVISLITCSSDHSLVLVGLDICQEMLIISHYLDHDTGDNNEVSLLIEHMKQVALSHSDVSVKNRACDAMEHVTLSYPHIIRESILPQLLNLFTLNTLTVKMETNTRNLLDVSSMLVSVSAYSEFQATILSTFINLLEQLAEQSLTQHGVDLAEGLVSGLCRATEKTVVQQTTFEPKLVYDTVVKRLLCLCIVPSLTSTQPPTRHLFTEEVVFSQCLSLFQIFTLAASKTNNIGECWFSLIHEILVENKSSSFLPQHTTSFQPLLPSSPVEQTRLIRVLTYTVGDMTKEIACSQASTYLPRLLEQAIQCTDDLSSSHSAMCYASIINKLKSNELEKYADLAMSTLWQNITVESDHEMRARSLTTWLWLIKALLLRSHTLGKTGALRLFDLFSDDCLSSSAADGFSVILDDSEIGLSSKSRNSTISLFWKQQFFSEIVPDLVTKFNKTPQDERQYFLRAMSHIMKSVPRQVLLEQLPLLHPLLMESLNSDEAGLSLSTLTGLQAIMTVTPSSISDHVPTLIPRLLALVTRSDSMKIRCSALSCLNTLAKLPRHLVYPYQKQVTQALVPCLDDKKRLVRKEAVKTQSNWFVLDTA